MGDIGFVTSMKTLGLPYCWVFDNRLTIRLTDGFMIQVDGLFRQHCQGAPGLFVVLG
jgi:hypothetical protein